MTRLTILAATLAALLLPSLAHAGSVAMRVQDVPLGARALSDAPAAMHFNMLAFHWTGSGAVLYRTHRLHGRWSPWVAADADVSPDGGTGRWHDGNLEWTGASDRFQVRRAGSISSVRAYELWSLVTTKPQRSLAEVGVPAIVPRAGWGADEEIVRAKPTFAKSVKLAVVHHTAGTNSYTRAQAPAIVRGIEEYHVNGNGWNDIGYNFLVDRFGTVYEGRAGGIDKNVVGAHSEGFNTGTVGVSLIGNFSTATPPKPMQDALVALLAWRLDVAHVDPLSTVVYTSGGNAKFKAGTLVTLGAVSGHRDTGPSECPGSGAYVLLPSVAKRVSTTGLPKLYSPVAAGALGGSIRFQARLSSSLAWTVTVVDKLGRTAASGSGHGAVVDWTWSSLTAGKGPFAWTVAAPGVRPATGTIGVGIVAAPAPLSLTALTASPGVVAPNLDGTTDPVTLSWTLGSAATVQVRVTDAAGSTVLTLLNAKRPAGPNTLLWDAGHFLSDGRYQIVVTAKAIVGTKSVTRWADVVIDHTLAGLDAAPRVFSPNRDGVNDRTALTFVLAAAVPVRLDIESGGVVVASPFAGTLAAGTNAIPWDGTGFGTPLFDGTYLAVVTVTDALGSVPFTLPVTIDDTAPHLQLLDRPTLTFTLDEPATVTAVVNGKTTLVQDEQAGTFSLPFQGAVTSVSAHAQDLAGNVSATVSG
jgi:hypothetical protein